MGRVAVLSPKLYVVHVGDSRCYVLAKKLQQVTTDHTMLQRRIDAGELGNAPRARLSELDNAL